MRTPDSAKVCIFLSATGGLKEVRVDAPVLIAEQITEMAVRAARRLVTKDDTQKTNATK